MRKVFSKDIKKFKLTDFIFEKREYKSKPDPNYTGQRPQLAGQITIRVTSPEIAKKILEAEREKIAYWQVAAQYDIKFPSEKRKRHTTGFSKARKANETSKNDVNKALSESAINAVNQQGKQFAYESRAPSYVKRAYSKEFTLVIFVRLSHKDEVFPDALYSTKKILPRSTD